MSVRYKTLFAPFAFRGEPGLSARGAAGRGGSRVCKANTGVWPSGGPGVKWRLSSPEAEPAGSAQAEGEKKKVSNADDKN